MKASRTRALKADCPQCGAPAGIACARANGDPRKAPHRPRIYAAVAVREVAVSRSKGDSFYHSDEWRRLRYQALLRSKGVCDCCGRSASREAPLHVDHIQPRARWPELSLDLSNLQVLCADCNLGKGAWDDTDWRSEARH